jgi:hypothetical protein
MKMRTRLVAATVAVGLVSGVSVAAEADSPAKQASFASQSRAELAARPSQRTALARTAGQSPAVSQTGVRQVSDNGSLAAFGFGRVGLRAVRPCVYRRQATSCVIKVRRLEQRRNRVVAIGVIRPRSNPEVRIPFQKRVIGVGTAEGIFGLAAFQAGPPSCAILNLVLGPLHLDLLGLVIDLNRVVLNIVGQTGAGNLLGNLLCALTGILDGGLILNRFLAIVNELLAAINAVLRL